MIIWFLLLMAQNSNGEGDKSHLFHEHGFLAKDQGKVYLNTNDEYFSIALHVAIPKFKFLHVGVNCHQELYCGLDHRITQECDNGSWTEALLASEQALIAVNKKLDIFEGFSEASDTRSKRGLGSFLGIGMGIFSTIFSAVSTVMISSHLNRVESDFRKFKARQKYINGKLIEVDEHLIKIFEHQLKEIRITMHNLECRDASVFQFSALRLSLLNWYKKLDELFYYIDRGSLGGRLNTFILSPNDLNRVITDHPKLKNTEYSINNMNFYLASNIYLLHAELDQNKKFLILHYVLQTPMLYKINAHSLFKIEKVPLIVNDVCMVVDSPKYMYHNNSNWEFFDLNIHSCFLSQLVSICYETVPQTRMKSTCLHSAINCTFTTVPCGTPKYVYHYSGVLVSGTGELYYLKRNANQVEARIIGRKFSDVGVAWVSWNEAEYVQYHEMQVSSPSQITTVIVVNYPDYITDRWSKTLFNRSIVDKFVSNISDLNSIIGQLESLQQLNSVEKLIGSSHVPILVYINSGLILLIAVFVACKYSCCIEFCKSRYSEFSSKPNCPNLKNQDLKNSSNEKLEGKEHEKFSDREASISLDESPQIIN